MNDSDSENSVKEIDFSRKSASSSEKFQQAQLNKTQSEDFQIRSKFSDNSDKSVIFSIEKAAFHRSKNKIILENPQAINLGVSKLCNLQEKAETLDKFLYKARENLDYSRELSNKKEEIITLNSRLNQLYIENQSMEEKLLKTDSKLKIITDEYNKGLNRITELEFSNKHLNEEAFSLKQKVYEYSIVNQTQKANIEKFLLENHHLLEKEANFQEYKDKIFEELNAKNKEIYDFLDMRKKMEVLKLEIYKDIQVLEEEKLGTFIEENDFIRLVKLLIKDRMFLKEEIRDKFELQQKMNKLNKCLEIQTTENRIVIEELTIQKRINENLSKLNFELEAKVFQLVNEIEEKKTKEKLICSIINDHTQIKVDLDRKDKIMAEILLLLSFYEQIRLAYKQKSNNNESNIEDLQNLFAYNLFKEDLKTLAKEANEKYPALMEKITELYPKKILNQENSSQYEIVLRNESATQMEKEELINYEEIEKMQRKFQETLTATVKMNEKTLNFYVEQIFGWNLVCNGNIVKLANLKNNLEVFFSAQNDKLVMLNREEMLKLIGNSASLTYPEIISYFTII